MSWFIGYVVGALVVFVFLLLFLRSCAKRGDLAKDDDVTMLLAFTVLWPILVPILLVMGSFELIKHFINRGLIKK